MVIYFDTEFTGLHKDTTLISIGLIDQPGQRTFYWEFSDYDKTQINDWLQENVIAHTMYLGEERCSLGTRGDMVCGCGPKEQCKYALTEWLAHYDEKIFLITDVGHYDMVLFIDIFGTAFDLPEFIAPTYLDLNSDIADYLTIDISEAFDVSREELLSTSFGLSPKGSKHNALYDARVIRALSMAIWSSFCNK